MESDKKPAKIATPKKILQLKKVGGKTTQTSDDSPWERLLLRGRKLPKV